ncbi:MAG TPA: hypothetical protein VFB50_12380 [Chloroflexota bacterium]|nr:hypothetical protein [Chloroflexota bacterium]
MTSYWKKATGNPDIDEDRDGEFNHRYATDPAFREQYTQQVAAAQRQLPEWLQQEVQGLQFRGTPGQGVDAYNMYIIKRLADDKQMLREEWNRLDIAEQDAREQDGWRPLDVGNAEQRIDLRRAEGMDEFTALEFAQLQNRRRQGVRYEREPG